MAVKLRHASLSLYETELNAIPDYRRHVLASHESWFDAPRGEQPPESNNQSTVLPHVLDSIVASTPLPADEQARLPHFLPHPLLHSSLLYYEPFMFSWLKMTGACFDLIERVILRSASSANDDKNLDSDVCRLAVQALWSLSEIIEIGSSRTQRLTVQLLHRFLAVVPASWMDFVAQRLMPCNSSHGLVSLSKYLFHARVPDILRVIHIPARSSVEFWHFLLSRISLSLLTPDRNNVSPLTYEYNKVSNSSTRSTETKTANESTSTNALALFKIVVHSTLLNPARVARSFTSNNSNAVYHQRHIPLTVGHSSEPRLSCGGKI